MIPSFYMRTVSCASDIKSEDALIELVHIAYKYTFTLTRNDAITF